MPRESVSNTSVYEDDLQRGERTRREIPKHVGSIRENFARTQSTLEELRKDVDDLRSRIVRIEKRLNDQDRKLSNLVEERVKLAIKIDKGDGWIRTVNIRSASDLLRYIKELTNESEGKWVEQAQVRLVAALEEMDTIMRVVRLLQAIFEAGDTTWADLAKSVQSHPLVIKGKIQPDNISLLIPLKRHHYLEGVLVSIYKLVNAWSEKEDTAGASRDYGDFLETGASLLCLSMLSDGYYEESKKIPPHELEFDCCGSLILTAGSALAEGGEIKSSSSGFKHGKAQLIRRFDLLAFVLPIVYSNVKRISATGWTYALHSPKDSQEPELDVLDGVSPYTLYRRLIGTTGGSLRLSL